MTKDSIYGIELAGVQMNCRFQSPRMPFFFQNYLTDVVSGKPILEAGEYEKQVCLKQFGRADFGISDEEKVFAALISDELLADNRLIFHSAAFILEGKAWLLAAPSGTGKTTQYRNLKRLHPDRIDILCGDNPVLVFEDDGRILVHHSPWNGKEGFGAKRIAELKGIVFLEQAEENEIVPITAEEAVLPAFSQFNSFLKTRIQVHRLFELERRLLEGVSLFRFRNTGNMSSSELLYNRICGSQDD